MGKTITSGVRPTNGCARCVWWQPGKKDNWGHCRAHGGKYWWQAPPCPEYERDPEASDIIQLIPYEE